MLYNPAMLKKWNLLILGVAMPAKIFAIFLPFFFAKMAKTILFLWPDFLLLLLMPPHFIQAPSPLPLKNKSKKSTKEITKGF